MIERKIRPVKIVDNLTPEIMGVVADLWEINHPRYIADYLNSRFGRSGPERFTATHIWNMAQILRRIDIGQL